MITFAAFVGGLATGVGAAIGVAKLRTWLRAFDRVCKEMTGIDVRSWLFPKAGR